MPRKTKFSLSFDSPITLIFAIASLCVAILMKIFPQLQNLFLCPTVHSSVNAFDPKSISSYIGLLFYALGSTNWALLSSNLVFILLLCPKVEFSFGKSILSVLMIVCCIFSGVVCICFSSESITGCSGIVCMLLILAMYSSIDKMSIPLSYILLALLYFGREFVNIVENNSLAVFCHFAGALVASLIGILSVNIKSKK